MSDEYLSRGVSATKDDVHRAIAKHSAGAVPGAFCKLVEEPGGDGSMLAVMHADGAGTKSAVAYLAYAETRNAQVFHGIAQDSLVMNTDDLACVGVTTGLVVSNTIGRNAHRVPGEVVAALIDGYERCAATLRAHGVEITLAGGETADVGDLVRTVIVDSTIYARIPRTAVLDFSKVEPGDLIVGLSSAGRARYEDDENSGIGSNGLTLARHTLLHRDYAERHPETFSETIASDKVYVGPYHLKDTLPGSDRSVGWGLLSPTRTYLPVIRDLLSSPLGPEVSGILHCSGGGQTKCLKFGRGLHYVKDDLLPVPAIFRAIEQQGIDRKEMFQVFNMGHRMEVYVRPGAAKGVVDLAGRYGVDAKIVGRIEAAKDPAKNELSIAFEGRTFSYS